METLTQGQELTLGAWDVRPEEVEAYLTAVGDSSPLYRQAGAAPPLAVVAKAFSLLLERLSLPPGSVHSAQEIESLAPVPVGSRVTFSLRVAQQSQRAGWQFMTLELAALDAGGTVLLRGKSTVMSPTGEQA